MSDDVTADHGGVMADPLDPPVRLMAGEWPEDPDEVPVWRLVQELHADAYGYRLPSYRTKREFEAMLEEARAALEAAANLQPPLSADETAERFLGFLRSEMVSETTVVLTSDELGKVYADWCLSENRHQAPENFVRAALKLLPGVEVQQMRVPGPGRKRTYTWIIRQMLTVAEETVAEFRKPLALAALLAISARTETSSVAGGFSGKAAMLRSRSSTLALHAR